MNDRPEHPIVVGLREASKVAQRRLTQTWLAKEIAVSRSAVSHWATYKNSIDWDNATKVRLLFAKYGVHYTQEELMDPTGARRLGASQVILAS